MSVERNNTAHLDHQAIQQVKDFEFITPLFQHSALRQAITADWCTSEKEMVPRLLALLQSSAYSEPAVQQRIAAHAEALVKRLRQSKKGSFKDGLVQNLLQEYSLSTEEGVALMCLAEALLRVPDQATRDALVKDKVQLGNWSKHKGQSDSLFVNATTWGLMITGRLMSDGPSTEGQTRRNRSALRSVLTKASEPLIRRAVNVAMKMMGDQFVMGESIGEALDRADQQKEQGFNYSFDMLGEAAMTQDDADQYIRAYEEAIHAIGRAAQRRGVYEGDGISIKLSALHPRYWVAQTERVWNELYPVLKHLAILACGYNIGLNIDAEEAERLELSIDLFEQLCFEPELEGWQGLGIVIQAYQKRAIAVVDYLIDIAKRSERRIMLRLVKGAYWDTEIKKAQIEGLEDYPVYTRKAYTDLSYLACAKKLLAAVDYVFPQFATHNAHTLAAIYEFAGPDSYRAGQYEFQCLYGMGEALYEQVVRPASGWQSRPCRVYAPVGTHETLLAYLARRLLENGANSSFVNQIEDKSIPVADLIKDPAQQVYEWAEQEGQIGRAHPNIPLPRDLYGDCRLNSKGENLADVRYLERLSTYLPQKAGRGLVDSLASAQDLLWPTSPNKKPVINPADNTDVLAEVGQTSAEELEKALSRAADFAPQWAATPPEQRARALKKAADLMEGELDFLVGILVREAGKTYANAIAEVREAIDFLRYYSALVAARFSNDSHRPLGPVVCISPWNFPMAIFSGQIAAALAAGNVVLAKPADQTPLVAAAAVRLFHEGGIPTAALQLLLGPGSQIGPLLTDDPRIQGIMFTGSTGVAKGIQQGLAQRLTPQGAPIPFVAETGGQNAMIVDSSALAEQVVEDIVRSAFDSAGQRCSALRVLYVQEDVADRLIAMIRGAMKELSLGNPMLLSTDVGPVIDARAQATIEAHIEQMRACGKTVHQHYVQQAAVRRGQLTLPGTFVPPTLIEIDSISELGQEIFGPVLHVIRYRQAELHRITQEINSSGYGLTMGLHTRIDQTVEQVAAQARVGNFYVNRNMVGAVVGVQPFGGRGLSGTGPKAGGPLYLYRLLAQYPLDEPQQPFATIETHQEFIEGFVDLNENAPDLLEMLRQWCAAEQIQLQTAFHVSNMIASFSLRGPTGEKNLYQWLPRQGVLCIAEQEKDLLAQLAAVLITGSHAIWDEGSSNACNLYARLPTGLKQKVILSRHWHKECFDLVLHAGGEAQLRFWLEALAEHLTQVVPVYEATDGRIPLPFVAQERAISINTAAAGGNASLMALS